MVTLHPTRQQPCVEAAQWHNERYLECYPDVYTAHLVAEDVVNLRVVESQTYDFVQDSGENKEPREAACERVPALLRVMERFAEDVLEEIPVKPEADEEKGRETWR